MPFPWKKGKNSKISKLVNNHLDSQRLRGGSLVVETGFPTSLVDLFVKNRQRLKKSSRKTKSDSLILDYPLPLASSSPEIRSWASPLPLTSSREICSSPLPSSSCEICSSTLNNMVEETEDVGKEVRAGENFKGVLVAVLRMFFVVVLALGTKKFAVGLTMSAFFLFFVEYFGICLYRLLMPCSEAKKRLRLMIRRIPNFLRIREKKLDEDNRVSKEAMGEQEEISEITGCSVLQNQRLISPVCEVPIIRPKKFLVPFIEDIQCLEEKEINEFGFDGKLIHQGSESKMVVLEKEECRCEVLELKKIKSLRAKIKTKMKHLFGRKSRSSKKEDHNLEVEISSTGGKKLMTCIEQEDAMVKERELRSCGDLSPLSRGSYEGKEKFNAICDSGVLLKEDMEAVVSIKEEEIENKENSGYLLLFLIVLIGLFGGRISALMCILSWCFVKKFGGKLRRCST
ncbi:hypothetical protein ACH5RR_015723 [Cinchona calisaya]|uniref:Ethylene-responsive nuclear protein n=1 Tax=Cinchona calisaya TaxID=153742 RepID=A0ABD2ZUV0_9GENT